MHHRDPQGRKGNGQTDQETTKKEGGKRVRKIRRFLPLLGSSYDCGKRRKKDIGGSGSYA